MKKAKIIAVVGPTASGKSALAEALAARLSGEVISCDSMQVYRGMDIGTAKPTKEEREKTPYHLIDVVEPTADFSAADYAALADEAVRDIAARGKTPIFCGGTGLYLDTFLRGTPDSPEGSPALRKELNDFADKAGNEALFAELQKVDPISAHLTHPNNRRRVVRALEIYRATGIPKSEWDRRSLEKEPRYDALVLGLFFEERGLLYDRIEQRVDAMMEKGLAEETAALEKAHVFERSGTAAGAIGYKELLPYVRGEISREEAVESLKTATRRYAKRQMTWFRAKEYVLPLAADRNGYPREFEEIVNNAAELCREFLNMV